MNYNIKIIFFIAANTVLFNLSGQNNDKQSPFSFGCDMYNRYIWRGINLGGNTASFQPNADVTFVNNKHSVSLGTFGAYSAGGQQLQEADIILSYTYNNLLNITVTDYFFPSDNGLNQKYFNYKDKETGHVFEGVVSFEGTKKIPLSLLFAMNFYGADARKTNTNGSAGNIIMSKYLELNYKKEFSNSELNIFVGAALDDFNNGETGFYGNYSYGVINTGLKLSKEISITDKFSLPVQSQLIFNPEAERIFLVFGFSL